MMNKFILLVTLFIFFQNQSFACMMVMPLKEETKKLASDKFLGEVQEYTFNKKNQTARIKYKVLKSIYRDTKSIPKFREVIFAQNINVTVPKTKEKFIKKYGKTHTVGTLPYSRKMQEEGKYRGLVQAPKGNTLPIIVQEICTRPYLVKE